MDERLHHFLASQITQRAANLLFGQHVIPHPERRGGVLSWRVGENFPGRCGVNDFVLSLCGCGQNERGRKETGANGR